MKMTGNTILITGGTSGIGRGLAVRLHEGGNKVIVAGRRKELLDEITAEHPGIDALVVDVADPDSIVLASEAMAETHPELNVLINNAGIQLVESVLDGAGLAVAEEQIQVNLLGTIRMTYAFAPQLLGKDDARREEALIYFNEHLDPAIRPALKAALRHQNAEVRVAAAFLLIPSRYPSQNWRRRIRM